MGPRANGGKFELFLSRFEKSRIGAAPIASPGGTCLSASIIKKKTAGNAGGWP